ncbi:GDSL Lipase/Acylhydrolase family protein-like protein [Hyaloscypha finlandica]|nr:GDSL Lipase/Acylhydrolase family protein-like protein [Hyaloscypha finlandica]
MGQQMACLDQFVIFGDSITQGAWDQSRGFAMGAELASAYSRRFDVMNRGFSGYNTDHALKVVHNILPQAHPQQVAVRFLVIWFGANDANKNPIQAQYVPPDRFKKNLLEIINHPVVTVHSPNIILITPPPFEETMLVELQEEWGVPPPTRKAMDAQEYAELVKEVGKEAGVPVLDVWSAFMEKAGWKAGDPLPIPGTLELGKSKELEELSYDGLHVSPQGYRIVFDELVKLINEKWPEYPPYKMPYAVKVQWEKDMGAEFWDVKNMI